MRILLIEDTVALAEELSSILRQRGYLVEWRVDGRDADILASTEHFDLIALDLGLPGRDGLDLLRSWRKNGLGTPIMVFTARGSWSERIDGLQAGADDYLCKPFHPEEFLLRIQALLRRTHGRHNAALRAGSLELDESTSSISVDGQQTDLTRGEFRLIRILMLNAGKIVSRTQLMDQLYDAGEERESNVIDVHINHLRKKIGKTRIETHRGQGYRLDTGGTRLES